LPTNSVEFYGCVFYTDYNIIGLDREIYRDCNFEEQVSTHEKNKGKCTPLKTSVTVFKIFLSSFSIYFFNSA
jgi:hypothetical protein